MKKRTKKLGNFLDLVSENLFFLVVIFGLLVLTGVYIFINFKNLPEQIPLFFNAFPAQLASRNLVWVFYEILVVFGIVNCAMAMIETRKGNYQIARLYNYFSIFIISLGALFLLRTINSVSLYDVEAPMIVKIILVPMVLAIIATSVMTPLVIRFAKKFGYIDDPLAHKHPGMLLKRPTPRAGGLAYILGILIPAIFILPIFSSQKLVGILLGAIICVLIGLKDDKKDIYPITRFGVQILTVAIAVFSGIIMLYIPNPFGPAIILDGYRFVFEFFGTHSVYFVSALVAMAWMLVTMNFMSFANGSDGVYAGLVFVASFVIAILMFQTLDVDPELAKFIKLAALSAGAAIGMAFFTWPSQKLLWGFGATAAGLIIASLSIIGSTKVATMLLVLLIPFFDGLVAVVRRIRRKQMPFWGDREHFHHKLLFTLGWDKSKVATFYWLTAITLGVCGILTSGRVRALWLGSVIILFLLGIALMNFIGNKKLKKI